jgi:hypothetical protein
MKTTHRMQTDFSIIDGNYTTIDVPGSFETFVYGINNAGQIVGDYYVSGEYGPYGFLYSNGDTRPSTSRILQSMLIPYRAV